MLLGICYVGYTASEIMSQPYGDVNVPPQPNPSGPVACCPAPEIILSSVRRLRPTLLKYETVVSVVPQTILIFLHFILTAFADLRRVNQRYCPTLLISLDYDNGFPQRQCENTDPVATSRSGLIHSSRAFTFSNIVRPVIFQLARTCFSSLLFWWPILVLLGVLSSKLQVSAKLHTCQHGLMQSCRQLRGRVLRRCGCRVYLRVLSPYPPK
ncbi:hypothetical protein T484DRAFT_1741790 [Baffinella frigidus]|nr:hypothetical protein T484DRAFT_1741790 [Cryptophyta sp. CCMP2293]